MKKINYKIKYKFILLAILCLGLAYSGTAKAEEARGPSFAPGEIIVKLKDGKSADDLKALNAKHKVISSKKISNEVLKPEARLKQLQEQSAVNPAAGIRDVPDAIRQQEWLVAHVKERDKRAPKGARVPKLDNIYVFKVPQDIDPLTVAQEYRLDPAVEIAEPNYIFQLFEVTPNDRFYSDQWAPPLTQTNIAWEYERGNDNIVIAIIDSGVDYTHEDLVAKIVPGYNFLDGNSDPFDYGSHGTYCAGIAAAITNNGLGISGISWGSKIMPVKVARENGGVVVCTLDTLVQGIYYAVDNGADVISLSLGGSCPSGILQQAIDYAYNRACIVIAAAGNSNDETRHYPAACDHVVAVAATDKYDVKADFSSYGTWVDISAPGVDILSTIPRQDLQDYALGSGTSAACPYVAGVMALMLSRYSGHSTQEIVDAVLGSADYIYNWNPEYRGKLGTGRVNAYRALVYNDTTEPTVPVVVDEGRFTNKNSQLYTSWNASDAESGILEYQYRIVTGTSVVRDWTSTGRFNYVTAGGLSLAEGRKYYIQVKAKNGAGLWSRGAGITDGITVDTIKPTGSIKINNNSPYAYNRNVILNLAATDSGSGMASGAQMCFSDEDGTRWSTPERYAANKNWVLSGDSGEKKVYVKFKDVAGNWSSVYWDSIILAVAPQISNLAISPSGNGAYAITFNLDIQATVTGEIMNLSGRLMRKFADNVQKPSGANALAWDGKNSSGARLSRGNYTVKITATSASGGSTSASKIFYYQ